MCIKTKMEPLNLMLDQLKKLKKNIKRSKSKKKVSGLIKPKEKVTQNFLQTFIDLKPAFLNALSLIF